MEKLLKYKALITKQKDLKGHNFSQIEEGRQFNAIFFDWPEVGKSFVFYDTNRYRFSTPIHTTEVLELIDERTIRTKNSIYTILTIEQQREDKIDTILN